MADRRLAVLGSPIAHSKSPALHRAAYEALELDWQYEIADVAPDTLESFIRDRGPEWRGLSLTMPLKRAVMPLLTSIDEMASVSGTANTLLFDDDDSNSNSNSGDDGDGTARVRHGFNTDIAGIVRALGMAGVDRAEVVHILGGGATAASAIVAAAELGAQRVHLAVRSLERSAWLEPLARSLGLAVAIRPLGIADRGLQIPDVVISTLPGGTDAPVLFTASTRRHAVLLDAAYDPWPSRLAVAWGEVDGRVLSGLTMLVHQALLQVRVFVSGDPQQALDDEPAVLAAMLESVGLAPPA